jgi:hypothetical protein
MFRSATFARLFAAALTMLAALVVLAPAAQAKVPAPPYERFAGCPSPEEETGEFIQELCLRSVVTGGHLQTGKKDVPIKNPITLTGGINGAFEEFSFNSEGGLSKVKQEVPGGVIGLTGLDWLVNFLNVEALKLYAVAELAGTPTNFSFNTVTLPLKVHLINPVLGNKCYIGSSSNAMTLNLITGTTSPPSPNKPITGKEPEYSEEAEVAYLKNGIFVDNSFAAPAAKGCVLTLLGFIPISLDSIVNSQAGLPSPAGTNEAVQNIDIEFALKENVY